MKKCLCQYNEEDLAYISILREATIDVCSDLLARLWPEAAGLAWLSKALALPSPKPGQRRSSRPALAWLWPEPWLRAGCGGMRRAYAGAQILLNGGVYSICELLM